MRGVATNYGLLLLLLVQSGANGDCPLLPQDWKHKRVENSSECHVTQHPQPNDSGEHLTPAEIRLEEEDKAVGTVKVEFPLRDALFYSVSLYVNERAATPQTCSSFNEDDIMLNCELLFHSEQRISNSTCENVKKNENCDPTCNLMGSVTFKNVYTGCYIAVVARCTGPSKFDPYVYSPARLLTTEYKKYPVWKMKPSIGKQQNIDPESQDYVLIVVIANFTMLLQERLAINMFLQNGTGCYFNHRPEYEDVATWTLALSDDGELTAKSKKDYPTFKGCWVDRQNVKCKFINMKTGQYCLGIKASMAQVAARRSLIAGFRGSNPGHSM
ncbi:uncharacterized protein [Anabrus simplex]|uniref:uncharacterized protein n=1 Tax=Anabrus simplex TaxID=316456 RepID=UPI0035A2F7D8